MFGIIFFVICCSKRDFFIESPCCHNSYGCYNCMMKYKRCFICRKYVDEVVKFEEDEYNDVEYTYANYTGFTIKWDTLQ